MRMFLLNILLAVLWCFLSGSFTIYTLLAGLLLGYIMIGIYSRAVGFDGYAGKVMRVVWFGLYFLRILIIANFQIAKLVLSPSMRQSPRIIRYDVTDLTAIQITTLANAISLTPGTLVMDISPDHKTLYIHCMFAADPESAVASLDELKDRLMSRVF